MLFINYINYNIYITKYNIINIVINSSIIQWCKMPCVDSFLIQLTETTYPNELIHSNEVCLIIASVCSIILSHCNAKTAKEWSFKNSWVLSRYKFFLKSVVLVSHSSTLKMTRMRRISYAQILNLEFVVKIGLAMWGLKLSCEIIHHRNNKTW